MAQIELGPDERRGITELNGEGEVVSGIVLQRDGQNALTVINSVKQKIAEIAGSLPQGVSITPVYDRSGLIYRAIETLKRTLAEESIIVALVCVVFLLHVRSALVAILMLPVGVLIAMGLLHALGQTSNIMSLGGIAIALGAMVDAAIVMIENAHKHLERSRRCSRGSKVLTDAAIEVGPALFFSLAVITVSFLPVFALEGQEGRMFRPLALTKTFAMARRRPAVGDTGAGADDAVHPRAHPSRAPQSHQPPADLALPAADRRRAAGEAAGHRSGAGGAGGDRVACREALGSEFMPTLNEGTLLFMPVSLPGLSVTKAAELLQTQDKIIKSFPEVESVFGKAGRADTATDPAPLEMSETMVNLKPEDAVAAGRHGRLVDRRDGQALQMPGVSNAWTMPIKARIDMLATGIRTPVGIKIYGPDWPASSRVARDRGRRAPGAWDDQRLRRAHRGRIFPRNRARPCGTGPLWPHRRRTAGNDHDGTRRRAGHHDGGGPRAIHRQCALRARPAVRSRMRSPARYWCKVPRGRRSRSGNSQRCGSTLDPPTIRTENAQLVNYIYVDTRDSDIGGYVAKAQRAVGEQVRLPPGYHAEWSGQFEYMQRAKARMTVVVPVTLLIIFVLLYLNFGRLTETLIVMLSVPFALIGGIWLI